MFLKRIIFIFFAAFFLAAEEVPEHLVYGIPQDTELLLNKKGFCIGYSGKTRQAVWVSYILYSSNLEKKVKRSNRFQPDPEVKFRPVRPQEYARSGYDKGHLAPAADMCYAEIPMQNSFLMSNISPQLPGCNRGIWKRLENQVRVWAQKEKKICVVTGPLFLAQGEKKQLKNSDIPIPDAFYKVILDMTPPRKAVGFIIPNSPSRKSYTAFAVSVHEVERLTGLDFFSELPDEEERRIEASNDLSQWE